MKSALGVVALAAGLLALAPADGAGESAAPAGVATGGLTTSILDPYLLYSPGPETRTAFARIAGSGATTVRLVLEWRRVVPGGTTRPEGFDPTNPDDPRYSWGPFDGLVRGAVRAGLKPLLVIENAPAWAGAGQPNERPSPTELAQFAAAAARHYGGGSNRLPRVRLWQVWNEPNLSEFLTPQSEKGSAVSPDWYRGMVNDAASAIHGVHRDNVVVAGGLAPFGDDIDDAPGGHVQRIHPLTFMRQMLCMSDDPEPKPTCSAKSQFDVWSHHPYTYGGPTHHAYDPNDVSIGDLGEMRLLLDAAAAAGHIQTRQKLRFWVTEFSWDTRPPDPDGLPLALHARWVSEALYRMWLDGVSLVNWWLLRDQPFPQSMFQSGLYARGATGVAGDRAKPALRGFRFPFVAFRRKSGAIAYWGRTPTSSRSVVVVEQQRGAGWRKLVTPSVDRYGIFRGRVAGPLGNGPLRARLVSGRDVSLAFGLTVPKDFRFCPWGSNC